MNDIDQRILNALQEEDRELLRKYDQPNMLVQFLHSFRGQWGIFTVLMIGVGFASAGLGFYCAYIYFQTQDRQVQELAAIGFLVAVIGIAMSKIMYYNYFVSLNMIRELKRLELQVSLLAERNE